MTRGMTLARIAVVALAVVAPPAAARAQAARPDLLATADGAVELRVGADDALVAELGYARAVPLLGRLAIVDGALEVPWDSLDAGDWRVRAGLALPLVGPGPWLVMARVAPTLRVTDNEVARLVGLGADLGLVAGYYAARWLAAAELGIDAELATHVTPSREYRMTVYDGAATGWYAAPGGIVRGGVQLGVRFGASDLTLRAGLRELTSGDQPALPLYATLGYARRW